MAVFALKYDRSDPRFEGFPDYVLVPPPADQQTAHLRRERSAAQARVTTQAVVRLEGNQKIRRRAFAIALLFFALSAYLAGVGYLVGAPVVGALLATLTASVGVLSFYVSFVHSRAIATHDTRLTRRQQEVAEQYDELVAESEETDRQLANRDADARARYREWWDAFREERGGFDLYLVEYSQTLPAGEGADLLARLSSDFESYFDFLRLGLVDRSDGKPIPMLIHCQRRERQDRDAGRSTTLADYRKGRAREAFELHKGDDDVARFLASRRLDALPQLPAEVK